MLHVIADLLGSAGVVIAGGVILRTGWDEVDAVASIGDSDSHFWSAIGVLRESAAVLLEAAPAGLDVEAVGGAMAAHARCRRHPRSARLDDHVGVPVAVGTRRRRSRRPTVTRCGRSSSSCSTTGSGCSHTTLQVEHEQGLIQLGR